MTLLFQIKSVIFKRRSQGLHYLINQPIQITKRGMKAYFQIIGQSSPEGPASLILNYDSQRYLFNCREGTQRLCVQEKVRLSKLNNVFLTRIDWDCIGGLSGMLLTLTDAGVRKIDVHGGKNLSHFIAATRHFVYRTNSKVDIHEYNELSKPFSDSNLIITPVIVLPELVRKRSFDELGSDQGSSSESEIEDELIEKFKKRATQDELNDQAFRQKIVSFMFTDTNRGEKAPGHTIEADCSPRTAHPLSEKISDVSAVNQKDHLMQALPRAQPFPAALSYICQGRALPRKFNKEAAAKLGFKPGPLYGQLAKGLSVTLEDGRVITQDMVCDPEVPGYVFMMIDCPSTAYIESLIHAKQFESYKKGGAHKVQAIVHFADKNVIEDQRYQDWLHSFDPTVDHIFGSPDICPQTVQFTSHAVGQVKLSMLNDKIFPIPKYNNTPKFSLSEIKGLPEKSHVLQNMTQYVLEPRIGIQPLDRPLFDHNNLELPEIKKIHENHEYKESIRLSRVEASQVDTSEVFPGSDVEIITLGTGSSIPAKYRNVSATLVKIPDYGSIMLDAGEGTYGQMMRRFGIENLDEEISKIKCLFISHLHADHHLGIISLINKWNKVNRGSNKTLTVVGPYVYKYWLSEYSGVEYLGLNKQLKFIRSETILSKKKPKGSDLSNLYNLKKELGLSKITPVEVVHCKWAYGLSLEHKDGWKLVYSGDTRPCDRLVEEGKDATVLIHEATLEDGEIEKAIAKRHSTTGEAIDVGKRMNARFTLLNHFSQRYPKLPVLSENDSNVCFSFDLMSIPIKEIPVLPKYTNSIQLAFKEEEEIEEAPKPTTENKAKEKSKKG